MTSYQYAFHVALDGNGVNGLEGMAGVCVFLFDPDSGAYAYKARYFQGVAAGHAVNVSPDGRIGFLGNAGQHLLFYDAHNSRSSPVSRRCGSSRATHLCGVARISSGWTIISSLPRSATTSISST